jgi:hypothetical protein
LILIWGLSLLEQIAGLPNAASSKPQQAQLGFFITALQFSLKEEYINVEAVIYTFYPYLFYFYSWCYLSSS